MNGVAVISQLTIDCIYADFPRFPEKGEELYAKHFEMTLGGGACVTPIRLSKMGVPTRFGTFFGEDMLSATARMLLDKYGATNVHNFYKGDKSPVIFSTIYSYPDDRGILTYDSGIIGQNPAVVGVRINRAENHRAFVAFIKVMYVGRAVFVEKHARRGREHIFAEKCAETRGHAHFA